MHMPEPLIGLNPIGHCCHLTLTYPKLHPKEHFSGQKWSLLKIKVANVDTETLKSFST